MFGKKKLPPAEQAKEWKVGIRGQKRSVERQIYKIQFEENRVKGRVTTLVKQGHTDLAMPIVASIAHSRKARSNLRKIATQLDSLVRQIDLQLAQLKVTGCFKQSAEVTHMLNQMLRLEEVQAMAQQMGMEMRQAGLVGELLDETIGQALEQEAPEDQELAVRLVYNEIAGQINKTAAKPVRVLPVDPAELEANPQAAALVN
jgi:division protein CdvB (Snf7/Vps24/ESCRT-III family)